MMQMLLSSLKMGWLPVFRSMMERRRCPKQKSLYVCTAKSSGPRCSIILSISTISKLLSLFFSTMPQIPHIEHIFYHKDSPLWAETLRFTKGEIIFKSAYCVLFVNMVLFIINYFSMV